MTYFRNIIIFLFITNTMVIANDFNSLKTFEAKFKQTITNPSGNKVIYNGLLYIQEPNKIKWQYQDPIEKLVYIKKYTVTIIEPELEQVIITKLDKEINILNLLKNAKKISNNKYISHFNNVDYALTLKNKMLQQISYKDEIENDVVISFENVHQNHKISPEIFKFIIPFDFDIIKK
jgi:outer membrane lipoprotein carrier protein